MNATTCITTCWMRPNASVNSSCAQPPPPPPRADPWALAFFWPWMANTRGWGLLSCQIPRVGDEKRGQMPRPSSTLQHFSLIAPSNNAVLNILMCDFFVSINSFLCNNARILMKTSRRDDMRQYAYLGFSIDIKLLTLKLIEHCNVICYKYFYKYKRMFFK